jgi:hypothetical protein
MDLPFVDRHATTIDTTVDDAWSALLETLDRTLSRAAASRYALVFHLEARGPSRSRLSAETRATFPGRPGRAYKLLVIGSRGHVVGVRRLLAATRRRAEAPLTLRRERTRTDPGGDHGRP